MRSNALATTDNMHTLRSTVWKEYRCRSTAAVTSCTHCVWEPGFVVTHLMEAQMPEVYEGTSNA
eukprot:1161775-Pelagomonas_calceolata.AAC.1